MAVLVLLVQHEGTALEVLGQQCQLALDAGQFLGGEDANVLQALGVRGRGAAVVQEELTIQDDVIASKEGLDLGVHGHAGFLPQQVCHEGNLECGWVCWPEAMYGVVCGSALAREKRRDQGRSHTVATG